MPWNWGTRLILQKTEKALDIFLAELMELVRPEVVAQKPIAVKWSTVAGERILLFLRFSCYSISANVFAVFPAGLPKRHHRWTTQT